MRRFFSPLFLSATGTNYQGKLTDGTNLVNGTVHIVFQLYTNSTSGDFIYMKSNTVVVVDGFYTYQIGKKPNYGQLKKALKFGDIYIQVTVNGVILWPRDPYNCPPFAEESSSTWSKFTSLGLGQKLNYTTYEDAVAHSNLWQSMQDGNVQACHPSIMLSGDDAGSWCGVLFEPVAEETHVTAVRVLAQDITTTHVDPQIGDETYLQLRVRRIADDSLARTLSDPIKISDNMVERNWFDVPLNKGYDDSLLEPEQYLELALYGVTGSGNFTSLKRVFVRVVVQ